MNQHEAPANTTTEQGHSPEWFADELEAALRAKGYLWEHVATTGDDGLIVNIAAPDGTYVSTLTISRTPGC